MAGAGGGEGLEIGVHWVVLSACGMVGRSARQSFLA
jgi:hypothetical protein